MLKIGEASEILKCGMKWDWVVGRALIVKDIIYWQQEFKYCLN